MTDFLSVDPSVTLGTRDFFSRVTRSFVGPNRKPRICMKSLWHPVFPSGKCTSVALNIHLCHAGCHARYIRKTFLCATSF